MHKSWLFFILCSFPLISEFWNGTDEIIISLLQGMYIVVVDFLSDIGLVNQYKKVVVLQK